MAATDSFALRVVNDIVHDLAAATAIAAPYASLLVLRAAGQGAASPALSSAAWRLFLAGVVGLVFLVVSGSLRLRYAQATIEPSARPRRTQGALIKHGVFVLCVLGGFALSIWVALQLAA